MLHTRYDVEICANKWFLSKNHWWCAPVWCFSQNVVQIVCIAVCTWWRLLRLFCRASSLERLPLPPIRNAISQYSTVVPNTHARTHIHAYAHVCIHSHKHTRIHTCVLTTVHKHFKHTVGDHTIGWLISFGAIKHNLSCPVPEVLWFIFSWGRKLRNPYSLWFAHELHSEMPNIVAAALYCVWLCTKTVA